MQSFVQRAKAGELGGRAQAVAAADDRLNLAALLLVIAYRITGSRWATLDPLKRLPRPQVPELEPAYYDLTEADLDREVMPASFVGMERTTLRNLLQALQDLPQRRWACRCGEMVEGGFEQCWHCGAFMPQA